GPFAARAIDRGESRLSGSRPRELLGGVAATTCRTGRGGRLGLTLRCSGPAPRAAELGRSATRFSGAIWPGIRKEPVMVVLRSQLTIGVTVAIIFGWGATSAAAATTLRWKFKEGERITYLIEEKRTTKSKADRDVFDLTQTLLLDTTWTVKAVDQNGKADI